MEVLAIYSLILIAIHDRVSKSEEEAYMMEMGCDF
jgi:hypothetical protein